MNTSFLCNKTHHFLSDTKGESCEHISNLYYEHNILVK